MREIIFLNEDSISIEYRPVSDIDTFKKDAKRILGSYGELSDKKIHETIKEIYIGNELVGYIGLSEYKQGACKSLGIGNFMILERDKGYGTKVIKDIIKNNKDKYDLIYCFVEKDNKGAIRFYKRVGKVYDEDGPNDNDEYYVTFWDNGEWKLSESQSFSDFCSIFGATPRHLPPNPMREDMIMSENDNLGYNIFFSNDEGITLDFRKL